MRRGRGLFAAFAPAVLLIAAVFPPLLSSAGCGAYSPVAYHKVASGETDAGKPYVPNYLPQIEHYRWAEGRSINHVVRAEGVAKFLSYVADDTRTGARLWEGPINRNGKHLSFLFGDGPPDIEIVFVRPGALKNGVIGRATPVVENGFIRSSLVQVDSGLFVQRNLFQAVVCHEEGHALGIGGHSDNPRSIMFWRVPAPEPFRDSIIADDVNTVRSIYEDRVPLDLLAQQQYEREGRAAFTPVAHEIRMEVRPDGVYLVCDLPGRKRSAQELAGVGPSAPLPDPLSVP